jgi:hypothetical protein
MVREMDALGQARKQLIALQGRRAAAEQRKTDLETQRAEIGYAAHTGDRAARKALDALHAEIGRHDSETASIGAAISEATRRMVAAQAAEAREADRQRAARARDLLVDMEAEGNAAAEALSAFAKHNQIFQAAATELARLGFGANPRTVFLRSQLAIATIIGAPMMPLVAPRDRITFQELVDGYRRRVDAEIATALGDRAEAA